MIHHTITILLIFSFVGCNTRSLGRQPTQPVAVEDDEGAKLFVEMPKGKLSIGTPQSRLLARGTYTQFEKYPTLFTLVPALSDMKTNREKCQLDDSAVEEVQVAIDHPAASHGFLRGSITFEQFACVIGGDLRGLALRKGNMVFYKVQGGIVFGDPVFPRKIEAPALLKNEISDDDSLVVTLASADPDHPLRLTAVDRGDEQEISFGFRNEKRAKDFSQALRFDNETASRGFNIDMRDRSVTVTGEGVVARILSSLFVMKGISMLPTLEPGDSVLVLPTERGNYEAGDVVLVKRDNKRRLRRIVGLPGDTVEIACQDIVINQQPVPVSEVDRAYFFGSPTGTTFGGGRLYVEDVGKRYEILERGCVSPKKSWTLTESQYFVLGDARNKARDSRVDGPVEASDIEGVAWLTVAGMNKKRLSLKRTRDLR